MSSPTKAHREAAATLIPFVASAWVDELARKYRTNDVRCWKPFIPPPPKESR